MPVYVPQGLPAIGMLADENIAIYDYDALGGRPCVDIALLNLMPTKPETERDIARALSGIEAGVRMTLVNIHGHTPRHTPADYMARHYIDSCDMMSRRYDGLIITGAPVELLDFVEVGYWDELTRVFDWAVGNVRSTLYICWAAQAGLYHNYGICKHRLGEKKFGVFAHRLVSRAHAITRGMDDVVYIPHSRHTAIDAADIHACSALDVTLESDDAGVYMALSHDGREVYVTGHIEYSPLTLDAEYRRDVAKGLDIAVPSGYYAGDDPANPPVVRWRANGALMFTNWVKYYLMKK